MQYKFKICISILHSNTKNDVPHQKKIVSASCVVFFTRYIIEIGSGAGYKTVKLTTEFHVIGVDFKANVNKARKEYPSVEFIEADLDVCTCKIC